MQSELEISHARACTKSLKLALEKPGNTTVIDRALLQITCTSFASAGAITGQVFKRNNNTNAFEKTPDRIG